MVSCVSAHLGGLWLPAFPCVQEAGFLCEQPSSAAEVSNCEDGTKLAGVRFVTITYGEQMYPCLRPHNFPSKLVLENAGVR